MNKPIIYGVFDSAENINQCTGGTFDNSLASNLAFSDFLHFKSDDEILLFAGDLYNADELEKLT